MAQQGYGQFCPVAMAAEVLCTRWTIVLLRELVAGSRRFNELRRGVPRMSPALLSQRLKELEAAGIVRRTPSAEPGFLEYELTQAGQELQPLVEGFGQWGQRWVSSDLSLEHLDATLLMWDMRRQLVLTPMPQRRSIIQFLFPEQPAKNRSFWLIVTPDAPVDLCSVDPGFDVDLYVSCSLRTMTAIWMGYETVRAALAADLMHLTGDPALKSDMQAWLGLSPFSKVPRMVA